MIRANLKVSGAPLATGEYISMNERSTDAPGYGTLSNNTLTSLNAYYSHIIGIDGYNTVTPNNASECDAVVFNDNTDAVRVNWSSGTAYDISNYKYMLLYTGNARTFTFA